jgi:hypothetical protein
VLTGPLNGFPIPLRLKPYKWLCLATANAASDGIAPPVPIEKAISGGQTDSDRGGLDWAVAHGVPHGEYCPRDPTAEGSRIQDGYRCRRRKVPNIRRAHVPMLSRLTRCR